jgi:subtilisin family serine protease
MVTKAALDQTPGRVIVRYAPSVPLATAGAMAAEHGGRMIDRIRTFGMDRDRYVVVSSTTSSTGDLMSAYEGDPGVEYAEPDCRVHTMAAVSPDDPSFPSLWGMPEIGAPMAWGITTGSASVVVADIDTGVDYEHPDLATNMWTNPGEIAANGVDDDANGYIDDVYGIDAAYGTSDP